MRELPLDHLAMRVRDRDAAVAKLELKGYTKARDEPFELTLEDGSVAKAWPLTHPYSVDVFVSSGPTGSKIDRWVEKRGGKGAVHHLAYGVPDVAATMRELGAEGVTFRTPKPIVCECAKPLSQVFTDECPVTGIIYEFIHRNGHPGFCESNVVRLMNSSPD
jgi:catechol 2,3-dioxygenase-like lactoylglutathione lyase family enzyme